MESKHAIDFLLYSYFGITLDSGAEEGLCAAIDRAYRDASSHALSVKDENVKREKKVAAAKEIRERLRKLVESSKPYDTWHGELCGELRKLYQGVLFGKDREFTYGIAQKWVNMTMKYLYLLYGVFEESGAETDFPKIYGRIAAEYAADLHAPIDSYILSAAAEKGVGADLLEAGNDQWSKIREEKPYRAYQKTLRGKMQSGESVIEWEGPAWIEQSERVKEKNKEGLKQRYKGFFETGK